MVCAQRRDDNVVLTTPENEELANIVQHRSVLGKTRAECSITGSVGRFMMK